MPYEDLEDSSQDSSISMTTVPIIKMHPHPHPFKRSNTCRYNMNNKNQTEARHSRPVRQSSVDERYSDSFFRSKPSSSSHDSSNNSPKVGIVQPPSSALITKMRLIKDKVHRHMIQTTVQSGDYPPPYVLFSDRYNYKSSLERHASDSSSMEPLKQRRCQRLHRGYSVDSYSMQQHPHPTNMSKSTDSSQSKGSGGIICSQTDMEAIKARYSDSECRRSGQSSCKRLSQLLPKRHSYPAMLEVVRADVVNSPSFKRQIVKKVSAYEMQTRLSDTTRTPNCVVTELKVPESSDCSNKLLDSKLQSQPSTSKGTPKDIEFDEHGQTWEIYGADPDPVLLGQAIQSHLDSLMLQNNIQPPSTLEKERQQEDNIKVKKFWKRWFCSTKSNRSHSFESGQMNDS